MTPPAGGLGRFVPGAPAEPSAPSAPSAPRMRAMPGQMPPPPVAVPAPDGNAARQMPEEKCEMCAERIPAEHSHLADLENSSLMCACRACYLLFTQPQASTQASTRESTRESTRAGRRRYRAVPDRYLHDPVHPMSTREWEELEIPVGLAFFLRSSQRDEVGAFYPSPAGATECRLDLAAWAQLSAEHPLLQAMEPDVEAALISRTDDTVEHFLVPIDACYELAGRMRLYWRGFDGGAEARQSIAEFLDSVRSRARFLPLPDRADREPGH